MIENLYMYFDEKALGVFAKPSLWVVTGKTSNDPYDSFFGVDIEKRIDRFIDLITNSGFEWLEEYQHYFDGCSSEDELRKVARSIAERETIAHHNSTKDFGVVCFSKTFDDIIMWGHYANGHRGFVIEFDEILFNGVERLNVVYTERPHLLDKDISEPDNFRKFISTKYKGWSYEQEVRLLCSTNDVSIYDGRSHLDFDPKTILRIYLGGKADEKLIRKIAKLVQEDRYRHVKVEKMEMSCTEYKITPVPFDLTPYQTPEAK